MEQLSEYAVRNAAMVVKDDAAAERKVASTLEQRVAIAVLQARAAECRHLAGELELSGVAFSNQYFLAMRNRLRKRSLEIEAVGMKMVEQYPPVEEPEESLVQVAR